MLTSRELWEKVKGLEHSNHSSDLYIPVNAETMGFIKDYEFRVNVTRFTSNIDGKPWYDVPFAYMPFWDKVSARAEKAR
jgi:hypothetical protein